MWLSVLGSWFHLAGLKGLKKRGTVKTLNFVLEGILVLNRWNQLLRIPEATLLASGSPDLLTLPSPYPHIAQGHSHSGLSWMSPPLTMLSRLSTINFILHLLPPAACFQFPTLSQSICYPGNLLWPHSNQSLQAHRSSWEQGCHRPKLPTWHTGPQPGPHWSPLERF